MTAHASHPESPKSHPYEMLSSAGVTPQSTHDEILNASFQLQVEGTMTSAARQAWDQVRVPSARLLLDFFLYNPEWGDPEAVVESAWDQFLAGTSSGGSIGR